MTAWAAIVALATASAPGVAECTATSAPDSDTKVVPGVFTPDLYVEERQNCVNFQPDGGRGPGCGYKSPPPSTPPPHGWGYLFGGGTWHYEEYNGLPGLQAGGDGVCVPECCGIVVPGGCVGFEDPVIDESCGAGPDRLIIGKVWIPGPL